MEAEGRAGTGGNRADGVEPAAAGGSLRPLRMLAPYLVRHRLRVALALIAVLLAAGATLAVPQAVRRVIDHGFAGDDPAFVNQYFAMLVVVVMVLAAASAARFYLVTWLGERVVADVRADVFERVIGLGAEFFDRTHSGDRPSFSLSGKRMMRMAFATQFPVCMILSDLSTTIRIG